MTLAADRAALLAWMARHRARLLAGDAALVADLHRRLETLADAIAGSGAATAAYIDRLADALAHLETRLAQEPSSCSH